VLFPLVLGARAGLATPRRARTCAACILLWAPTAARTTAPRPGAVARPPEGRISGSRPGSRTHTVTGQYCPVTHYHRPGACCWQWQRPDSLVLRCVLASVMRESAGSSATGRRPPSPRRCRCMRGLAAFRWVAVAGRRAAAGGSMRFGRPPNLRSQAGKPEQLRGACGPGTQQAAAHWQCALVVSAQPPLLPAAGRRLGVPAPSHAWCQLQ
jgi:hypothetical protein